MGTTIGARTAIVGIRRVFARRRGEFRLRRRDAGRLGPHRLGADRRPRRPDPDPADLRRDVRRRATDRARSAASRCRRRRRTRSVAGSRSGPTSSTRWTTSNNAVYLDWLEEAILAAPPEAAEPRRSPHGRVDYRLEYALAAEAGAELEAPPGPTTTAGATGSPTRPTGADLFRARLEPGEPARTRRRIDDPDRAAGAAGCSTARAPTPRAADVAIEDGRIVGVGTGLDGDEAIDVRGRTILPGLFDCHTHVMHLERRPVGRGPAAVLAPVLRGGARTSRRRSRSGSRRSATPAAPTSGSSRRSSDGLIAGPRMQISIIMLSQTGGHGDDWYPSGAEVPFLGAAPGPAVRDRRRRRTRSGARSASCTGPAPT